MFKIEETSFVKKLYADISLGTNEEDDAIDAAGFTGNILRHLNTPKNLKEID